MSAQLQASPNVVPYYSICPVFVVSHVALERGFLHEELDKVGAGLQTLDSFSRDEGGLVHARHSAEFQIRDGGNVPAIWARADVSDTVLLGTTNINQGGAVVVRVDSGIHTVQQLLGRRLGVSKSLDPRRVDWWRANSLRSLQLALDLAGVARDSVEFVDVPHAAQRPNVEVRSKEERTLGLGFTPELGALARGEVDAIYSTQGRPEIYERTGQYKVIQDLTRAPDWTVRIATTPYTLVASRALVEQHPEVAVAWLRANIRAARWVREAPLEAARIFHKATYDATVEDVLRVIDGVDFTPSLSAQNLAAVRIGKDWLRDNGFIANDFDVQDWADGRFLEQALTGL
jgi:ABC-type nitrate/sulfonate/bicarbonate transport system substrate-binding protein